MQDLSQLRRLEVRLTSHDAQKIQDKVFAIFFPLH